MADNLSRTLGRERFLATFGGLFALVALLLVAVGLYGVMSQVVASRTREIGIRIALGAGCGNVLWMVLLFSVRTVATGTVAGLSAALVLMKYTESLLFGVSPRDPLSIASAVLLLFAVTSIAGFVPALRATRVLPMEALRQE